MINLFQFISKLFWLILFVVFGIFIAIFVGSNTQTITLYFWPIPEQIRIVIWLAILLAFCSGLVLGAFVIWLNSIFFQRNTRQKIKQGQINTYNRGKNETEQYLVFEKSDK